MAEAPKQDGPVRRLLRWVTYPTMMATIVVGGGWAVHTGVDTKVITTVAFVFMMVAGVLLERLLPFSTKPSKPSVGVELVNSAVNLLLGARLFRPLFTLAVIQISVALTGRSGLFAPDTFGPWWVQALLAFLMTDAGRYVVHRAQHRIPALWALHRVHHSVLEIRTLNLSFSHPLDYVLRNVVTFYVPVLLGFSEQGIVMAVLLQYATGIPSHYNLRLHYGVFSQVFVTSRVHRWHHALDLEDGGDANFGAGLTLWDRLFGTFHLPAEREAPEEKGIPEGPPRSVWNTLLVP